MKRSEWYRELQNLVTSIKVNSYVGQRLTKVSRGRAEFELDVKPHHLQSKGQMHGGWYGMLADTAGFFAVMSLCNPGDGATTLEYKINLMDAATMQNSPVIVKAKVIKRSGSIAVAAMEVIDRTGNLLSTGIGTYRIFAGKAKTFQEKLENKGVLPPRKGNRFSK